MSNDTDSGLAEGTPATPIAGSSQGQGDSGGSFDAGQLQKAFEAMTRKLDEVDARSKALQGDKDRGVAKTNTEVADLKRKIAEIEKLKKAGLDEDGAFEEHSFREDVRAIKDQLSKLAPVQTQTAGNSESSVVNKAKIIADNHLDGNDLDVVAQFVNVDFKSPLEAENAALKLALRRANPSQPDISAAPGISGRAPQEASDAQLIAKYQTDMIAAAGNKALVKAIKEKARKDGVPVDTIAFV